MADQPENGQRRQRVEQISGSRRARLTPAPGSDPAPESRHDDDEAEAAAGKRRPPGPKGPNDDRLIQDVPPHY